MNDLEQKILKSLNYNIPTNMTNLMTKSGYRNKKYLIKAVDRLEKEGYLSTRKEGRERLILKPMPLAETVKFVSNYGGTLKNYAKFIKDNLKQLEKNMPLVPDIGMPMKKIKIKVPKLKLVKKKNIQTVQGIRPEWTYKVQGTKADHAYTWRTRAEPLKYFNAVLNTLNKLYQESSAISFSEFMDGDPSIKEYQKKSKVLIKETLSEFERIFKEELKSRAYAYFHIKNTLYGLIHQIMLDEEKSKLQ